MYFDLHDDFEVQEFESLLGGYPAVKVIKDPAPFKTLTVLKNRFAAFKYDEESGMSDAVVFSWTKPMRVEYRVLQFGIVQALELIEAYAADEGLSEIDWMNVDLREIPLAYTTLEDDESVEIQVVADLIALETRTYVGGALVDSCRYKTLEEMCDIELQNLSFDWLVSVDDEQKKKGKRAYRDRLSTVREHVIWSNESLRLDDWIDGVRENIEINGDDPDDYDESELEDVMCQMNDDYLGDEQMNLNVYAGAPIIVISTIGRWDGTSRAAGAIESGVIGDCLERDGTCPVSTWYVDPFGDLRYAGYHHDGKNTRLYRAMKPNHEAAFDALARAYVDRDDSFEDLLEEHTVPLGSYIGKVYGWTYSEASA